MANEQDGGGQYFAIGQGPNLHSGTCCHQAQSQRRSANPSHGGLQPMGQRQTAQVGQQTRGRGQYQGVAQQFFAKMFLTPPSHGPNGGHIHQGNAHANEHRNF